MIIKNAIRCNICGDEIESKYRHDFVECSCGSCAVDGGHDYLRRCFKEEGCYTEISEYKNRILSLQIRTRSSSAPGSINFG